MNITGITAIRNFPASFTPFVGEALKYLLPLPVPASIYGMVILFVGLLTGLIKRSWVKDAGKFKTSVLLLPE